MNWIKKGIIFNVNNNNGWMCTHASIPIADHIKDDKFRIYFSPRDSENRSSTAHIELDINNTKEILEISKNPAISPGELGGFDDSGAMASSIVTNNDQKYLYYVGWNKGVTIPYSNSIGLAISNDGGKTFQKHSKGPIIGRDILEPFFTASSHVLIENGMWKMWYLSCIKWNLYQGKPNPHYHIKYAESKDGIDWQRKGIVCIDFKDDKEWAISRPCVIRNNEVYKMWYSYRGEKNYRIGFAESKNGIDWKRKDDQVGIDVSEDGWDSEMIEYPYVFEHKEKSYMLYCGNGYGKTGFGYAILE